MKPDLSDTLAKAQEKAAERPTQPMREPLQNDSFGSLRRCIFRHDVPANHGYEIKAGFVCYIHSGEFDTAGG